MLPAAALSDTAPVPALMTFISVRSPASTVIVALPFAVTMPVVAVKQGSEVTLSIASVFVSWNVTAPPFVEAENVSTSFDWSSMMSPVPLLRTPNAAAVIVPAAACVMPPVVVWRRTVPVPAVSACSIASTAPVLSEMFAFVVAIPLRPSTVVTVRLFRS